MVLLRKWLPFLTGITVVTFLWNYCRRNIPVANGDQQPNLFAPNINPNATIADYGQVDSLPIASMPFWPGPVKSLGEPYMKALIVPRTKDDDVSWIGEHFGGDPQVQTFIYSVDASSTSLHVPKNKGHEVMVYLSYIIENYHNLAEVNIFIHAHRYAWHNNELLGWDSVQVLSRLSAERVQREGYVNLRCHWDPGCPAWINPGASEEDMNKQEQTLFARSWLEIFPLDPIPAVLAQPCCGQFAVSGETIRTLPLARYVLFRDWLLRTPLSDYISGRVWEYMWQFVFTGKHVVCPKEHVCYCDGFGVCFGGEEGYNEYDRKTRERNDLAKKLEKWKERNEERRKLLEEGHTEVEQDLIAEAGMDVVLENNIKESQIWCDERKLLAKEHGDVAKNRALEAGRPWKDGDGF